MLVGWKYNIANHLVATLCIKIFFFLLSIDEGDEDDDDDQFQELEEAIYRFPLGDNGDDDLDLMIQYPDESNIGKSKFWFKISPLLVEFAFFSYNKFNKDVSGN